MNAATEASTTLRHRLETARKEIDIFIGNLTYDGGSFCRTTERTNQIEIFVEFLDEGGVGRPGQNSEQIGLDALVDASQQIKRALRRWGQILDDHATQGEQHASPFRNPRP